MAINKVVYGNSTLIDLTEDTVSANNLLAGETAHDRSGAPVVGSVVTAEVVDNLTTQDATKALSANQGYVLKQALDEVADDVDDLKVTEEVDTEPYLIRQSKGNMADIELVGGSVAWNQLVQNGNFANTDNWVSSSGNTFTVSNNVATFKAGAQYQSVNQTLAKTPSGHKIFFTATVKSYTSATNVTRAIIRLFTSISPATYTDVSISLSTTETKYQKVLSIPSNIVRVTVLFQDNATSNWGNITIKNVNFVDLTQAFGGTVADYIYNLEQTTSGSGVAFFRKYFPNAYYAYDSGSIQSVCASERKVVGFNQWDEEWELGGIGGGSGQDSSASDRIRSKNYIPVIPNKTYYTYFEGASVTQFWMFKYASDKSYLGYVQLSVNTTFTIPNDCAYIRFFLYNSSSPIVNYDKKLCINISNTGKNGQYEPYKIVTYPLPNTELRGIPTLVDNKLKYDGDTLKSNGKVTRKYGIDDFTSLTWSTRYTGSNNKTLSANLSATYKTSTETMNLKCLSNKYDYNGKVFGAGDLSNPDSKNVGIYSYSENQTVIYLVIPVNESAQGSFLYELATSTTESASPFQNPQRSDASGTEEFVDYEYDWMHNRDVAIPVGHNTKYISSEALAYSEDYADGLLKYVENDLIPPKADIMALTNYDFSGMTTAPLSISKDDYFYMDGSLCKALVNINQGATLTYYTNYITCSVATELNELRNKTEWHEVLSGTKTLSTTEDETLMWSEASYNPTYFGCDFFVFSDLAGFYLKDFSYGGHNGSITFPKWSSAVTVKYKIMAKGEANQSGSGITTYYNAPILNQ